MKIRTLTIALALLAPGAWAESFLNQSTPLDAGYRHMYNLEFDAAHRTFADWERTHPDDPLGPVSDAAAYLFSEFERLHVLELQFFTDNRNFVTPGKLAADPAVKQSFEKDLASGQALADRILARAPDDHQATFATVLRMGLQADYLALVEKRNLAALADVKAARELAEKLLAADPNYGDAYLAVGVENYLLSLKAAPIRWLLRAGGAQTDRDRGIETLSLTAERGHYLQPYARVLLAVAALRDKKVNRAKDLLESLAKEFPHNQLYAQEAARLR